MKHPRRKSDTNPQLATIEDLRRLAKKVPDNWHLCELFNGTRCATEAEVMVAQTIQACVHNYDEYNTPFSFRGDGVFSYGGGGLVNNGSAYHMLLNREYFVERQRKERVIILVTKNLVDLLDVYFKEKKDRS